MDSDNEPETSDEESDDPKIYKASDRVAYTLIGVYSLIHIIWAMWVFSDAWGAIDTMIFMGIIMPILALLILICCLCSSGEDRFSALATFLSFATIGWWLFFVWFIVFGISGHI